MIEAEVIISADDLYAGYTPGVNILNGCSMEVRKGELIGIIGPNGAGKSTFLKALFGLVTVRTGVVTFAGDDITNMRPNDLVARGIGFVPQSENVFPSLSIEENLEMGAYQRPKSFDDQRDKIFRALPRAQGPPQSACRVAFRR